MQRFDHRTPRLAFTSATCALLAVALVVFGPKTIVFQTMGDTSPILWVLVSILTAAGIASHLSYRNERFEIQGDRIRKFDLLNRKTFDASLHEVIWTLDRKSHTCLLSPKGKTFVSKSLRNYGRLIWHLEGLKNLDTLTFSGSHSFRYYPVELIALCVVMIFGGEIVLADLLGSQSPPFIHIWLSVGIAAAALLGFGYLHAKNARIEVNSDGLRVFNFLGREISHFRASEIIDAQIVDSERSECLWIYSITDAVRIHSATKGFEVLTSMVNNLLNDRKAALTQRTAEENVEVH